MSNNFPFQNTETGFRHKDFEILFGLSGRGGVLRSNSLILHGPRKIVVDPAGSEERHIALAKENPILFFTHYHGDHRMSEHHYSPDSTVWTSTLDAEAVGSLEVCAEKIGGDNELARKMIVEGMLNFMKLRDWKIEKRMNEGDVLEAGGCRAKLVHFPGHTPGHMGLFFDEQSLLYMTDIDLTSFGPWYGNEASDKNEFRRSVKKAKDFECDWYYTSHGKKILNREEFLKKVDAFDAHFDRRDKLLLDALANGERSIDELCQLELVYKTKTLQKAPHMLGMEKVHVDFHLKDLIDRELIKADDSFQQFCMA